MEIIYIQFLIVHVEIYPTFILSRFYSAIFDHPNLHRQQYRVISRLFCAPGLLQHKQGNEPCIFLFLYLNSHSYCL